MTRKTKITYGISNRSKSIGVAGPKGSYGIDKNPFSTTYRASGTTNRGVNIGATVTKPKYGSKKDTYYGIQVFKKF
ncbi:MAG: hypothetical protein CW716_03440 [Candidatus Bathyarchaeum sp.]|nr:MAG: hypothetical protein CW716_03440 [Candidatus Bathyarchaeum sp.]